MTATSKRFLPATLVLALVVLLAATGCVAIPDASSPQPVQGFSRSKPTNLVPTPRRSDDPESLVRSFVKAMADPAEGHRAARRFLTPAASERWDDQGSTTVIDDVRVVVDERSESAVRLRVSGERVGVLSPAGRLTPTDGELVMPLLLTRANGVWRIEGDVPAGTVTDAAQFGTAYRLADLYFPDRGANRLVGDPRWLFGAAVDPTELVTRLLDGPAPDLRGGVEQPGGRDVRLRGPVEQRDEEVSVALEGLADADARTRTLLAAQVVWTLDEAGIRGTYRITADGAPLIPERTADGWRTADVKAFDPEPDTVSASLHVVRGGLFRVADTRITPVGGPLGAATDLRTAAISVDSERVTAVADRGGRQVLLQGRYGEDVTEVATAQAIGSPSFGAVADTGFAIVDGRPVQWSLDGGPTARVTELDISQVEELDRRPITAFDVSPDGVRVAMVVGGRVLAAVLATNDRGVPAVTGVQIVSHGVLTPVVAITWAGAKEVYLAREGSDTPIMRIPVSGLPAQTVVSGNLKPPVRALAATRSTVYAGDSNGVLELGIVSGSADQYWTSVGDTGDGAVPVAPG